MKTICITAAQSKLGKTTLAERLIPYLPEWGVCKVTACVRHRDQKCPRKQEDTCGICNSLEENFEIEDSEEIIKKTGTDTGRYAAAGAKRILWIKSKPPFIEEALNKAISFFTDCKGIIFEGNHVLKHLSPNLAVMIVSRTGTFKQSALAIRDKVDLFFDAGEYDLAVEEILRKI